MGVNDFTNNIFDTLANIGLVFVKSFFLLLVLFVILFFIIAAIMM